jgi:hypothetical protein
MEIKQILKKKYALLFIAFSSLTHSMENAEQEQEQPLITEDGNNENIDSVAGPVQTETTNAEQDKSQLTETKEEGKKEDTEYKPLGMFDNCATFIYLILASGCTLAYFILSEYAKSTDNSLYYFGDAHINTFFTIQCNNPAGGYYGIVVPGGTLRGFDFTANIPLYNSQNYIDSSMANVTVAFILSIVFIGYSALIRVIEDRFNKDENRKVSFIILIIQMLLCGAIVVPAILALMWLFADDSTSVTTSFTLTDRFVAERLTAIGHDLKDNVFPNVTGIVQAYVSQVQTLVSSSAENSLYQYPMGYSFSLSAIYQSLNQLLNWLNIREVDDLFLKTIQTLKIDSIESTGTSICAVNNITTEYSSYLSTYFTDIPDNANAIFDTAKIFGAMLFQSVTYVLSAIFALLITIANALRINHAMKSS